ncbi:MAG: arginyltransferase [Desulfurivibrionaceae bacterium]|nr:arginyltransferase [Desulfurivibrionaceae bacterium]
MSLTFTNNEKLLLKALARRLRDIPTECPYGLDYRAVYRMARLDKIPEEIMGTLLAAGYRRYGDTIYTMACEDCQRCIPIKLDPFEFRPNRSQRRCAGQNRDLTIKRTPLTPDQETTELLQSFFDHRFPGKNNRAGDYYAGFFLNSSEFSMAIRYYSGEKPVGVSVIDIGKTWLNAVYFFFDPATAKRSPGTFNIINLITLCREHSIRNLYLGYWIEQSGSMNYKAAFSPHYLLIDGSWRKVG